MIELLRKSMLTGLGLAVLTKDKIEELGREMIKQGEVSEKEGKEFLDELMNKSEQARGDFQKQVDQFVKDAVAKLHLASREDVAELKQRIERLEEALKVRA